ncbi:hypothetical protein B1C78_02105 [Thioalkalivibrio denitrificans]|uniref:Uncharacterized protein n=2 Tax=Thioalkalivibrio denitrificans TaxID=108003 RepID=A0A1V3NTE0_9GAMM|nr:hypothetical protein B1C78_02105 [Thioalkalivibrio denitrificans]
MTTLSGCAWIGFGGGRDAPPDEHGLYATHGGDLQRLDGDREWEMETWEVRSNLSPGTEFVIRHPEARGDADSLKEMIQLRRVAWVRSEITREGDIGPVDGSSWAVTEVDSLRVPFTVETMDGEAGVVRVIPDDRLERGLYSLQLRTRSNTLSARLGVDWNSVDRRQYSATHCVDRYLGEDTRYRPCAQQEQALASRWLRIHLVEPEMRDVAGQRRLVVQGVVINTSERKRRVPTLEAQLRSGDGEVLKRWRFDPATAELEPGDSARFRGEVPDPPSTTRNVHVTFSSLDAS